MDMDKSEGSEADVRRETRMRMRRQLRKEAREVLERVQADSDVEDGGVIDLEETVPIGMKQRRKQ